MKRLLRLAAVGTCSFVLGSPSLAQQGAPNKGTQNPGNQNPGNQNPANQNPGNQVGRQTERGTTGQSKYMFGGINQAPWFANSGVRSQLKLTDDQFNRLNTAYGQHYGRYNTAYGQLGKLSDEQRAQRTNELSGTFYTDFGRASNDIFQPEQRQRFNQLGLQYRGYDVFSDPTIRQQLRLTDEQVVQFQRYGGEYTTQLADYSRTYGNDRDGSTKRFTDLRKNMRERINSTLTEEQRRTWRDMYGDSYNFELMPSTPSQQERPDSRPEKP